MFKAIIILCIVGAEDVGLTVEDLDYVHGRTRFVTCISPKLGKKKIVFFLNASVECFSMQYPTLTAAYKIKWYGLASPRASLEKLSRPRAISTGHLIVTKRIHESVLDFRLALSTNKQL